MGINTVARAAFMLRYFGVDHVRILNGGLKKWMNEHRPVSFGPSESLEKPDGDYRFEVKDPSLLSRFEQVSKLVEAGKNDA